MKISPSTFYYKTKNSRTAKEKADADLRDKIETIQTEFHHAGYRQVKVHLQRKWNMTVNWKKIRRVMNKYSLYARVKKQFISTTNSNHPFIVYPNLISGLEVTDINQVWVSDITYIRIATGFVYLAVIIDIFSRRVVGWGISKNIDHDLTTQALTAAIKFRKPAAGLIHHSDRGVQYACREYVKILNENNIAISMSAKGNPYENAFAESFMKTIKKEEVYLWEYENIWDVLERIPLFIEQVYNKKRLHSGIGYLPPEEFEEIIKYDTKIKEQAQILLK